MKYEGKAILELAEEVQAASQHQRYKKLRQEPPAVTVHVGLLKSFLAGVLDFNLVDFFQDPELRLATLLKAKLFLHEHIADDTLLEDWVPLDYTVALESSLFGLEPQFRPDADPMNGPPVLKKTEDLAKLQIPDFYTSGLMPEVHKNYRILQELTQGMLRVSFPGWARGPWSIACMLRGFVDIYMDVKKRPDFVHSLMQFIVDSRISWEKQRLDFLGMNLQDHHFWRYVYPDHRAPENSDLYNDEVDGNLFSVNMYREFILPYEKQLADFYGRTYYYHSCGNLTPFLEAMRELPLQVLHVSSWTDLSKASTCFGNEVIMQKSMKPEDDVLFSTVENMEQKIREVLDVRNQKLQICADAISAYSPEAFDNIKRWVEITRKLIGEYTD